MDGVFYRIDSRYSDEQKDNIYAFKKIIIFEKYFMQEAGTCSGKTFKTHTISTALKKLEKFHNILGNFSEIMLSSYMEKRFCLY